MTQDKMTATYRAVHASACLALAVTMAFLTTLAPVAGAQTTSLLPGAPGSFSELAKTVRPSVVNSSTVKTIKGRSGTPFHFRKPFGPDDPFKDFFDRFFGNRLPENFRQKSLGSGFIINEKGYILTNNHVVEKTDEIKDVIAGLSDGKYKVSY